jgi:hypothetical protein
LALEASVCRVFERKVETLVVDVDSHNLLCAVGLCDGAAEESNGASAEYDDRVSRFDAGLACNVYGDGGGFDECAFLHAHVGRQLVAVVLW